MNGISNQGRIEIEEFIQRLKKEVRDKGKPFCWVTSFRIDHLAF